MTYVVAWFGCWGCGTRWEARTKEAEGQEGKRDGPRAYFRLRKLPQQPIPAHGHVRHQSGQEYIVYFKWSRRLA